MSFEKGADTLLIAQKFPSFDKVALRNKCVLTCDEQKDGMGGILAFGAKSLLIDETSKIDMSGKGKRQLSCKSFTKTEFRKFLKILFHKAENPSENAYYVDIFTFTEDHRSTK